MEPVISREIDRPVSAAKGVPADLMAMALALFLALGALTASLYFFSNFLENDAHLKGIIASFLLCFGLGSLGYVPGLIIAALAHRTYRFGLSRRRLIWVNLLTVPWLALSTVLVFSSGLPAKFALPLWIAVLCLSLWAFTRLIQNVRA